MAFEPSLVDAARLAGSDDPAYSATAELLDRQTGLCGRPSAFRVLLLQRAHDRGRRRVGGGVGVRQGEGVSAGDLDDPRRKRVAMLADVEAVARRRIPRARRGTCGRATPARGAIRRCCPSRLRRQVGVEKRRPQVLRRVTARARESGAPISAAWSSACAYPKPKPTAASVSAGDVRHAERVAPDDHPVGQRLVGVERGEQRGPRSGAQRGCQDESGRAEGEHGRDHSAPRVE